VVSGLNDFQQSHLGNVQGLWIHLQHLAVLAIFEPEKIHDPNYNQSCILVQLGVSENSVPLNPMVNDHYPY
jgi:hypothetical protein